MAKDKKTPLYNYKSPGDYKVFNMGNEPSPAFKMKYQGNKSAFPFKSPLRDESEILIEGLAGTGNKPLKGDLETEGDMPVKKGAKATFTKLKKGAKETFTQLDPYGAKETKKETGKRMITDETKMRPPYKKPVGPRE